MRDLGVKSFGSFEIKNEERGEVTAIVATLEVVDRDGDVILPGSFPMGGAKVKLSGYGHDIILQDAPPVGIGTISEEGGKAIFEGRFFMSTERGREAFATVKELGTDGEWSFGFPNATTKTSKMTDAWREKGAKRLIAALQPVEASPVFRGAGVGTMTMHTKAMDTAKAADESLSDRMSAVHEALYARNRAIPDSDTETSHWWAREVFDEYVIVEAGPQLFRVQYVVDDEGKVTLGEATEVEIVYQAVAEKSASPDVDVVAPPVEDPEAKAAATAAEEALRASEEAARKETEIAAASERKTKAKAAAAVEEYERVQRTLRRLRVG